MEFFLRIYPPGPIARYGPKGVFVWNMLDVLALLALGQFVAMAQCLLGPGNGPLPFPNCPGGWERGQFPNA